MKFLNISLLSLAATTTTSAFTLGNTRPINSRVNTDVILPVVFSVTIFHATLSSAYALPFLLRFSTRQLTDDDGDNDILGPGDAINAASDKQNATEKKKHKHNHNQDKNNNGDKKNDTGNGNGNNNNNGNKNNDPNAKTDPNGNKNSNGMVGNSPASTQTAADKPKKADSTGSGTLPSGFPPATPSKGFVAGQKL